MTGQDMFNAMLSMQEFDAKRSADLLKIYEDRCNEIGLGDYVRPNTSSEPENDDDYDNYYDEEIDRLNRRIDVLESQVSLLSSTVSLINSQLEKVNSQHVSPFLYYPGSTNKQ